MTETKPQHEALARRIDRLERFGRSAATIATIALLGLGVAIIEGTGLMRPRSTIEAERFILRDTEGRVRARLEPNEIGATTLTLYDDGGNEQLQLWGDREGNSGVFVIDSQMRRSMLTTDRPQAHDAGSTREDDHDADRRDVPIARPAINAQITLLADPAPPARAFALAELDPDDQQASDQGAGRMIR